MKLNLYQRFRKTKIYYPNRNKCCKKRLYWKHIEAHPYQEGRNVVKGTSKRVVVVKSPDSKVFEQAIFIVREDYLSDDKTAWHGDIIKEAQAIADNYIRSSFGPVHARQNWRLSPALCAAVGVFLAMAVWIGLHLFGIL